MAVVVLLDRQSAASLTVRRHIDAYHSHHIAFGMREMITKWTRQVRGNIQDGLDSDGLAFTMQLPGGNQVRVYFADAQGLALADTSQFTGRRREILDFMKAYVQVYADPQDVPDLLRPAGPGVINITTAPRVVLEALASACVEPDQVEQVVQTLMNLSAASTFGSAEGFGVPPLPGATGGGAGGEGGGAFRAGGRSSAGAGGAGGGGATSAINIAAALADLNISEDAQTEIAGMTTATSTLWQVVCVEEDARGPLWRAGGLFDASSGSRESATFDQGGPFLTWESLPLD